MSRMSISWRLSGAAAASALAALWWARRSLVVVTVSGTSMTPALRDGDRVLVRRRALHRVRRGDVVVLEPPLDGPYLPGPPGSGGRFWNVKRVAALPGDPLPPDVPGGDGTVPAGTLAVLGDDPGSVDSRMRGVFPGDRLLGVVVRRMTVMGTPGQRPSDGRNRPSGDGY
ncbi:S26 family signal peptidase [Actinomadura sp. LOL_016]|uniref:S26 family signal peptidase n=2 Tax=unclassified Actinomadura TaxID=2626254 RepID=UPI003A884367